jgi:hypothetical protein
MLRFVGAKVSVRRQVVPVRRDLSWIVLPGAALVASVVPFVASLLGAGDVYVILAGLSGLLALVTAAVRLINAPLPRGVATPVDDGALVQLTKLGGLLLSGLMVYGVSAEWPRALLLGLAGLYAAWTLGAGLPVSVSVGLDGLSIRRVTGSEFLPLRGALATILADVDAEASALALEERRHGR